jgi:hypothetical protein
MLGGALATDIWKNGGKARVRVFLHHRSTTSSSSQAEGTQEVNEENETRIIKIALPPNMIKHWHLRIILIPLRNLSEFVGEIYWGVAGSAELVVMVRVRFIA